MLESHIGYVYSVNGYIQWISPPNSTTWFLQFINQFLVTPKSIKMYPLIAIVVTQWPLKPLRSRPPKTELIYRNVPCAPTQIARTHESAIINCKSNRPAGVQNSWVTWGWDPNGVKWGEGAGTIIQKRKFTGDISVLINEGEIFIWYMFVNWNS